MTRNEMLRLRKVCDSIRKTNKLKDAISVSYDALLVGTDKYGYKMDKKDFVDLSDYMKNKHINVMYLVNVDENEAQLRSDTRELPNDVIVSNVKHDTLKTPAGDIYEMYVEIRRKL